MLRINKFASREGLLIVFRFLSAGIQFLIIQQITSRFGISFVGEYSTVFFANIFTIWLLSSGLFNVIINDIGKSKKNLTNVINDVQLIIIAFFVFVPLLAVYHNFLGASTQTIIFSSLFVITRTIMILCQGILIGYKKYFSHAFQIFFLFLIVLVLVFFQESASISNLMLFWFISSLIVSIGNYKIVKRIFKLKPPHFNTFGIRIKRLLPSYSTETSNYLYNRGEFFLLTVVLSKDVIGIYYIYLQIMEGVSNIVKAIGPIIQREFINQPKKSFGIFIGANILIISGLLVSVLSWELWSPLFHKDLVPYLTSYKNWSVVIFFYCNIYFVKYALMSYSKFKIITLINIISIFAYVGMFYGIALSTINDLILIKTIVYLVSFIGLAIVLVKTNRKIKCEL